MMTTRSSIAVSLLAASAIMGCATNVQAQSDISDALATRGNPKTLAFLRDLRLPPNLMAAVRNDVLTLEPEQAKERIADRFRLELVGNGTLAPQLAAGAAAHAKSLSKSMSTLSTAGQSAQVLRVLARDHNLTLDVANLKRAIPDSQALAAAYASFRFGTLQTTPGTAIDPALQTLPGNHTGPGVESPSPSPGGLGRVPAQTTPGTDTEELKDCDKPFEALSTPDCMHDGMRCETFSRKKFGEVVRITTPNKGTCSGTLVSDRWVLSAAHCFLPSQSARDFAAIAPMRKGEGGDALIQLGDLAFSAVHALYAGLADSFRPIEQIIVHREWDPKTVIAAGQIVSIDGSPVKADWAWPGDLALVRLKDDFAVKTVVPAKLAQAEYEGFVTTAGYGVTTIGDGHSGDLWVTWPDSKVTAAHGQLDLEQKGTINISTFCNGDSGGPAFEGRQRGCPTPVALSAKILIGVTSHYYGDNPGGQSTSVTAGFCMSAPVMRFINVATPAYRNWICGATGNAAGGC